MAASRCEQEIEREGFDVVAVAVAAAGVNKLAAGSSFGRPDVEALTVGGYASCLTACVVTEWPLGFDLSVEAMRLVSHDPESKCPP